MHQGESDLDEPMQPRGRDLCHGMEYHFFDNPTQVKILPHTRWTNIAEPSWVKILNGQPIWLNITGMS